jgi:hypothetical protein
LRFRGDPNRPGFILARPNRPFGGAENPPITFICELKKQVRRSFVLLGEGQCALKYQTPAAYAATLTATDDRLRNPDQLRRSPVA